MALFGIEPGSMSAQRRATAVSISAALFLTVIKIAAGIVGGSVAVLASAIDSVLDMAASAFNFFAIKKAEEHPSDLFPYGKGKIQAIAGVIEGTVIVLSGLFIIFEAVLKIIRHESVSCTGWSLAVMIFSLAVTWGLVKYLLRISKETDNIVIKADALHYRTDLLSNGAVIAALAVVYLSGWGWVDALFGLGIGIYIIYSAFELIKEGTLILLDRSLSSETVAAIGEILANHPDVEGYHYLKTRTDGSRNYVEFHMVLKPEMTLHEAHEIAEEIEYKVAALEKNKGWVITPHFDPYDDEHVNEIFYNGEKISSVFEKTDET